MVGSIIPTIAICYELVLEYGAGLFFQEKDQENPYGMKGVPSMKMVIQAALLGFTGVVVLASISAAAEKESAVVFHFVEENKISGEKTNWDAWINSKGTKFQSNQPTEMRDPNETTESQRITYFNGDRPGFYDIDPVNNTHRIFDKKMAEQQKHMMEDMRAQFGMGQSPPMGKSGAGEGKQDFMKAIQQAQEKMRQAKLQALEKAKKEGDLTPEAEREWRQNIGGPSGPTEMKKTGKTRKTQWGTAIAYEEHRGEVLMERNYILPWSKVPNGDKPQKVNDSMEKFLEDIKEGFPQMNEMEENHQNIFKKGFPVITEEYSNNELVSVTTFTGTDKQLFAFGPSKDSVEESMMSATSSKKRRGRRFSPSSRNQDMQFPEAMNQERTPSNSPGAAPNSPRELPPEAADALKQLQQLFGGGQDQ